MLESSNLMNTKSNFKTVSQFVCEITDCVMEFMNYIIHDIACGIMNRWSVWIHNFNGDHLNDQLFFLIYSNDVVEWISCFSNSWS